MEKLIYYFFIFLAEAAVLWQYTQTLFIPKYSAKIKLAVLCGLYLVLFAVSLLDSKWINITLYFLLNFLFFLTQCRSNARSAFFHSALLTSIMTLCEVTVYYMAAYFSPHFFAKAENLHNLAIFAILSKLLFFMVVYSLLHFLKRQQTEEAQRGSSFFLLTLIPLSSVFIIFTFMKLSDSLFLSPALNWMLTLNAVFLLVINLLVFGIDQYNRKKSLEFTEMRLMLQKESDLVKYYEMLLSQHENQSILIHDMKKHLQSLHILNDKMEHDKIRLYIQELLKSSDLKETCRLCDHELLNAVLCGYQTQCLRIPVAFHTDIRSGTIDFMADAHITSLFCNLLDNAVEAASHVPHSFIEVSACSRERTPFTVITVVNSCEKDPLICAGSHRRGHGFGLKSIRKVIANYHGEIQMYYQEDTLTFHTVITLKRPVSKES